MNCHSQVLLQQVSLQLKQQAKAVGEHRGVNAAALRPQEMSLELRITKFDPRLHRGEVMLDVIRGTERLPLPNVSTVT